MIPPLALCDRPRRPGTCSHPFPFSAPPVKSTKCAESARSDQGSHLAVVAVKLAEEQGRLVPLRERHPHRLLILRVRKGHIDVQIGHRERVAETGVWVGQDECEALSGVPDQDCWLEPAARKRAPAAAGYEPDGLLSSHVGAVPGIGKADLLSKQ